MTPFRIFGETVSHTRVSRYSEVLVLSPELETQRVEKTNSHSSAAKSVGSKPLSSVLVGTFDDSDEPMKQR